MEKPNALEHFRGESGYNCAQAVLKAYASCIDLKDACLERFSRFGGGRAPEGECGALFAAKSVFRDVVVQREVEGEFLRTAGSRMCRDIRVGQTCSCEQCVQTAADAVWGQLDSGRTLQKPVECER